MYMKPNLNLTLYYTKKIEKSQQQLLYLPGPERLLSMNLLFVKQIHHCNRGKKTWSTQTCTRRR